MNNQNSFLLPASKNSESYNPGVKYQAYRTPSAVIKILSLIYTKYIAPSTSGLRNISAVSNEKTMIHT